MEHQKLKDCMSQRDRLLQKKDYREAATMCNKIGNIFSEQNQHENALQAHEQELKLSTQINDKLSQAIAHRRIAECLKSLGQFEDAVEHAVKFKRLAEASGDLKEVQRAEATMASILLDKVTVKGEEMSPNAVRTTLSDAEDALDRSLKVIEQLKSRKGNDSSESTDMLVQTYKNLSLIHEWRNDEEKCIDFLNKVRSLAVEKHNHNHLADADMLISQAYVKWKKPDKALISAKKCLKLSLTEKSKFSKEKREEFLRTKARCLIHIGKFGAALKCFKTCWKLLKTFDAPELIESVKLTIFNLHKIVEFEDSLSTCSNLTKKCSVFENLGDLCSNPSIDNQQAALDYYLQQEKACQELKLSSNEFQSVYSSVAQTAKDLNRHSLALEYFQKEISACDSESSKIDSLLNVALVQDSMGSSVEIVVESFEAAATKARGAKDDNRVAGILEKWLAYVEKMLEEDGNVESLLDLKTALKLELSGIKFTAEESSELPDSTENQDEFQGFDPGDIFNSKDSDDSDIEESEATRLKGARQRGGRRGAIASESRNEHGETALHEAAKSGDARRLKKLLEMKKQVNSHDFTGISPLHDAAIGGFYEVVNLLLKAGADIDDPGVNWKQSKTPFLCAAAICNLQIMRLLMSHGARADAKDYEGRSYLSYLERQRGWSLSCIVTQYAWTYGKGRQAVRDVTLTSDP